ncbi:MAG: FAD-dependent oxidoreductase, partial [Clostridiaceae bacterium]|nr:FAD-dependent oxidoreductase [Clostridiaceae bacterium]
MEKEYDIVVIGAGPAGLAAAIEARKNSVERILLVERAKELGGILQQCIHNGFGLHIFKEELTGPEYAERFIKELMELGIDYKLDTMVLSIDGNKNITMINARDGAAVVGAKAIILAMGCRERPRGALNIPGTRPSGIFTAGTAQRFVNIEGYMVGRKIVVLGSGDIGMIMARRMMLEGAEVKAVLEILPYSSGLIRNKVQCLDDFGIPLLFNHTITEIKGKERVEGIVYCEVDNNRKAKPETRQYMECDTLLLSVGLIPENELSKSADIKLDPVTGGPVVDESMETSMKGIFACGNVLQVHDLVDYVTEESRKAGRSAAKYVKRPLKSNEAFIEIKAGNGIRYVVPQRVGLSNMEDKLELFMRVDDIYKE